MLSGLIAHRLDHLRDRFFVDSLAALANLDWPLGDILTPKTASNFLSHCSLLLLLAPLGRVKALALSFAQALLSATA
jgi:hypothetical protein